MVPQPLNAALAFMSDASDKLGIPPWEFRVVFGSSTIDYDPDKEDINRAKHKYSLASAVSILEKAYLGLGDSIPSLCSEGYWRNGEVRHNHLSIDDAGIIVQFVTTMRDEEAIRVISLRPASSSQRDEFSSLTGYHANES